MDTLRGGLSAAAYDKLESMIVMTQLAPGSFLTLQQVQDLSGLSRTPIHDAVKRMDANQLIFIRPRSGLIISPIDLDQAHTLIQLRIEMEIVACCLAGRRATSADRMRFTQFIRDLSQRSADLDLDSFSLTDRLLNSAIIRASGEPLLENTLMPLQSIYRRTGWIYHRYVETSLSMEADINGHTQLLQIIIGGSEKEITDCVRSLYSQIPLVLDEIRRNVDPALLDVRLATMNFETGINLPATRSRANSVFTDELPNGVVADDDTRRG